MKARACQRRACQKILKGCDLKGCGVACRILIFGMALPSVLFCGALKLWYEWILARHNGIEADKIGRTRKLALVLTVISVPLSICVMTTNTSACSIAACGREIPFGLITATLDGLALVVFLIGLAVLKWRRYPNTESSDSPMP